MLPLLLLLSLVFYVESSEQESQCNLQAFKVWFDGLYDSSNNTFYEDVTLLARSDKKLWQVLNLEAKPNQNQNLSNGQVMYLTAHQCTIEIKGNIFGVAGKHYPIEKSDQQVHDAMCSNYCLINDELRSYAMRESKCNCLELSTQPDDLSFHVTGDFCLASSGRILYEEKEKWCGLWPCLLEDFHCFRREYNRQKIPFRGYGWECSPSSLHQASGIILLIQIFLFTLSLL